MTKLSFGVFLASSRNLFSGSSSTQTVKNETVLSYPLFVCLLSSSFFSLAFGRLCK